jgi:hypothetical protein
MVNLQQQNGLQIFLFFFSSLKVAKDDVWWVGSTTIATKWIANCTSSSSYFIVAKDWSWVGGWKGWVGRLGGESTNATIRFWNLVHGAHEGY